MTFDWPDFLAPLSPAMAVMAFALGLSMGLIAERVMHQHLGNDHLYWQLGSGFVFFVPLALLRAFEGAPTWERFLAIGALWIVFCLGKWIGSARP